MTENKKLFIINRLVFLLLGVALGSLLVFYFNKPKTSDPFAQDPHGEAGEIKNFEECAAAGYPIMESYPERCRTPEGNTFTRDIGNEMEKTDMIRVSSPRPGAEISSPVIITGEARGNWYFEGSFPVKITDIKGNILAESSLQAQGEWMTEAFVPFRKTLSFNARGEREGFLVLQKDNPSGLLENADELRIPVKFAAPPPPAKAPAPSPQPITPSGKKCVVGGCSGEICEEEGSETMTICIYRPEFACYKNAKCERQASGSCGWTATNEFKSCIGSEVR